MMNNGQMIAGGIIEGLLKEEENLAATAVTLAEAFIDAFNAKMAEFQITMQAPTFVAPTIPQVLVPPITPKVTPKDDKKGGVVLNVYAGVGTNGTQVGKQIVREVGKALKSGTAAQTVFGTGRLAAGMI
jgi:hypothetical protein